MAPNDDDRVRQGSPCTGSFLHKHGLTKRARRSRAAWLAGWRTAPEGSRMGASMDRNHVQPARWHSGTATREAETQMTRMSIRYALIIALALALLAATACGSDDEPEVATPRPSAPAPPAAVPATPQTGSAANQVGPKEWSSPPALEIDPGKKYTATIELKKGGEIEIELFAEKAPKTVNNFVFLSRQGYYDDVTFHRVIPGFMAQTGDPTGTGSGGPGYQFDNEFHPDLRHSGPGILSMANRGLQNGEGTNGGQFFITFVPTTNLDGLLPDGSLKDCSAFRASCHSVFGQVVGGMDVLNGISVRDPGSATTPGDAMKTIRIEER